MDADAVILLVVLVLAAVVAAICLRLAGMLPSARRPVAVVGGAEGGHPFGEAIADFRLRRVMDDDGALGMPPPASAVGPRPVFAGAERRAKPRKHWTECETWEELQRDKDLHAAYWKDVEKALVDLDLDWSDVRGELQKAVYDDREWAGRINIVGGRPKIVELVPSPHRVGEGPLEDGAAAMVPHEVVERISQTPALFFFHTHPGLVPGGTTPSTSDIAMALDIAYTGRFAADLVISPYGVFLYTPSPGFRKAIWKNKNPKEAQVALLRRTADVVAAFGGAASWTSPWTLETYESFMRNYGVEYIVFPTDLYAALVHRYRFTTPPSTHSRARLRDLHARIRDLEKQSATPRGRRRSADVADAETYGDSSRSF